MKDFPQFMKKQLNHIDSSQQNTPDIDGYYYEGKEDLLGYDRIEELISLSKEIQSILGEYLDIEFAIRKNEIYILQARPITTLKVDSPLILDNSNIVESYPGISLPLTISFVEMVYSNVFRGLAFRLTKNQTIVDENEDHFQHMVGSCNGRVYYQISNWYHFIQFLPFSKKIIPIWQDMMGVQTKTYDQKEMQIPFFTRLKTYFITIHEFFHVPKNMEKLNHKFDEIYLCFQDHFQEGMSSSEIIELYQKVKDELFAIWDITLVNDLYAFLYTGLLKKRLKKKHFSDHSIQDMISGITNIESLKPIRSLISLAYQKEHIPKEEFLSLKEEYISLYGDRNLEELKLESETFRTNPELLEERIQEYQSDPQKLRQLFLTMKERKPNPIPSDWITRFLSKRAMLGIQNREISRLNRTRIYGMVRSMFLAIGTNYVQEKKLQTKRDIFYLTVDELFHPEEYSYQEIVEKRKEEYALYSQLPNYSHLIFSESIINKHPNKAQYQEKNLQTKELVGTPCSTGVVEGEALVIQNVHAKQSVKDKILITKMTDPGWVFLLATAKGVISEKGSLLSHTAIISREIGIPSIVGVEGVLHSIHTGDRIRMDGSTGKIEILERGKK